MKRSKLGITFLSCLLIFGMRFLPAPAGLTQDGLQVFGVFSGVLLLWVAIGIDWPSLLCLLGLALVPSLGFNTVFKTSFGSPTFAFLLFTFIITHALSQTSVIAQVAYRFIKHPWAQKSPWTLTVSFLSAVLLLGLFMSPTVLFFIMLPILETMFSLLDLQRKDRYAEMLLIGLVMVTCLSSGMTPIAHVFPILALNAYETITQQVIPHVDYMKIAIPLGLMVFILMLGVFRYVMKPDTRKVKASLKKLQTLETLKLSRFETGVIIIFSMVVLLWILPGIFPETLAWLDAYGSAFPPLLGVLAMAFIHIEGKPLVNINDAMSRGVSWPSLIMVAATSALGSALTHESIGLVTFLSETLAPQIASLSTTLILVLFLLWAALQSSVSSHMVTAQVVTSIAVPIALATGINGAALACLIGFIASCGFATPPAMPFVAVAQASGWTQRTSILKYGTMTLIAVVLLAWLIGYPLADAVL